MKTLIVEDEALAAKRLSALLAESPRDFEVLHICDSVRGTLEWLDNNPNPDIMFLDIQLSDGHSFEIFEQRNINCPIIFTTAFDEYAIRAFQVNSIDYLLKPFQLKDIEQAISKFERIKKGYTSEHNLSTTLEMLASQLEKTYKSRFFVKSRNKAYSIAIENIPLFYFEDGEVLLCRNDQRKFLIRYSLDELQKLLDPSLFFRISRKQIISINYIQQINTLSKSKLSVLMNDIHIVKGLEVSKHRVSEFRSWLDR